jgi:hypothetical protein
LQAVEAAPPAAKAHAFRLAKAHPVDGPLGAGCQGLGAQRIDVVSNPGAIGFFGKALQGIVRKAVGVPQARR